MVDSSRLRIGQILDEKYVLEKLVGKGGTGTVYRARHISLGAARAIKIIRRELLEEAHIVERFRAEALMAETLRHPNLVTLYDFASLPDGTPYIVWEYVEGETVTERLSRDEAFSPREVVDLVAQIADGLSAAHQRGILHRDVSPDNIMIGESEGRAVAKVLDFGVAKMSGQNLVHTPGSGVLFGKIGYSSPEQMGVMGSDLLDSRTDVFSLGVVAYLMLVGKLPFRNHTVQAYLQDIVLRGESEVQAELLEFLDEPWQPFFLHALSRNRESRTLSMEALKKELRTAFDESGARTAIPRAGVSGEGRRWAWRTLPVAAAVAGIGVLYWSSNSGAPDADAKGAPVPEPEVTTVTTTAATTSEPPPPPTTTVKVDRPPTTTTVRVTTGRLHLQAIPKASVAIDGSLLGITPMDLDLVPGRYEVVLTDPEGGLRWRGWVEVVAGSTTELERRLAAVGTLTVVSDVWVEVSLDGGPGEQTPISFSKVGAGLHELRAHREGFRDQVFEVSVEEGQSTKTIITMEKNP